MNCLYVILFLSNFSFSISLFPIFAISVLESLKILSVFSDVEKATEQKTVENRNYKGINFFCKDDKKLMLTLARGEFNIYGFRSKDIEKYIHLGKTKISRTL